MSVSMALPCAMTGGATHLWFVGNRLLHADRARTTRVGITIRRTPGRVAQDSADYQSRFKKLSSLLLAACQRAFESLILD